MVTTNGLNIQVLGFLLLLLFVGQLLTGIIVQIILVDVTFMSTHLSTGSSWWTFIISAGHAVIVGICFFIMYGHMSRFIILNLLSMMKETLTSGLCIFIISLLVGFMGYVVVYGDMSLWACVVILNLLSGISGVWCVVFGSIGAWYGYVSKMRYFHGILSMVMMIIVVIHLLLLHVRGSNSSSFSYSMTKVKNSEVNIGLTGMWVVLIKDLGLSLWVLIIVLYCITAGGLLVNDADNYLWVNLIDTPLHIAPEWYFVTIFVILLICPSKLSGLMYVAVLLFGLAYCGCSNSDSTTSVSGMVVVMAFVYLFLCGCNCTTVGSVVFDCSLLLLVVLLGLGLEVSYLLGLVVILMIVSNVGYMYMYLALAYYLFYYLFGRIIYWIVVTLTIIYISGLTLGVLGVLGMEDMVMEMVLPIVEIATLITVKKALGIGIGVYAGYTGVKIGQEYYSAYLNMLRQHADSNLPAVPSGLVAPRGSLESMFAD